VPNLPGHALKVLAILSRQALGSDEQIREIGRGPRALQRRDLMARRLATIPGIGPIGAFPAAVTDPGQFQSCRQFTAWLGLTPLRNSSGGKERLGRISKMGDKYLRRLLVIGATALVATVAMANKMARIVWALMTRGETYRTAHALMLCG
jgi:transposase